MTQKNNIGGIPKLSSSSLTTVSTISANSLLEQNGSNEALIESAWGPDQQLDKLHPERWFSSQEILKIMKTVRFIYEVPKIEVRFYLVMGVTGEYEYKVHKKHFDLTIVTLPAPDCGLIFPGNVHTKGVEFNGVTAYATEFTTLMIGGNECTAVVDSSSSNAITPYAITEPPLLYSDFFGLNGSAAVDLLWGILSGGFTPAQPVTEDEGYPRITFIPDGPNSVGVSYPYGSGPILVDDREIGELPYNFPPDPFAISAGYTPPTQTDNTLQPVNWEMLGDQLKDAYPQDPIIDSNGNSHLAQPIFNTFQIKPTDPDFLKWIVPELNEPYFGTASYMIYILAQPLVNPPDSDLIARAKAQRLNFAARIVLICVDVGYLTDTGCGLSPGLIATTINTIVNLCSELSDCGFQYGGQVDYKNAADNFNTFKDMIDLWIETQPNSQTEGPDDGGL